MPREISVEHRTYSRLRVELAQRCFKSIHYKSAFFALDDKHAADSAQAVPLSSAVWGDHRRRLFVTNSLHHDWGSFSTTIHSATAGT